MTTCKAAWLVLRANMFQLLIYLLATGVMAAMLGIGIGLASDGDDQTSAYGPPTASLAIIDRDSAGGHATGAALRSYLSSSADIVDIEDTTQAIQDAIATDYVDVIVIVPQGYTASFTKAARTQGALPTLSLAGSGNGTDSTGSTAARMLTIQINGFLGSLKSAMLAGQDASLAQAAATVAKARAESGQSVQVAAAAPSHAHGSSAAGSLTPSGRVFAATLATMLYPLMLNIAFIVIVIITAFNKPTTMRRVGVSAESGHAIWAQVLLVCCGASAVVWLCCIGVVIACSAVCQGGLAGIGWRPLLFSLIGTFVFSLTVSALGFLIGQCRVSTAAMNGIVNTVTLASAFLSGAWLPQWLMSSSLQAFARLLPGWWYVDGVYDAFGGQGSAMTGTPDIGRWAAATGLMALFALAFIAVGLAVSRFAARRQ